MNVCEADSDSPVICAILPSHRAEDCEKCYHVLFDMYVISKVRLLTEMAHDKDTPFGPAGKCPDVIQ